MKNELKELCSDLRDWSIVIGGLLLVSGVLWLYGIGFAPVSYGFSEAAFFLAKVPLIWAILIAYIIIPMLFISPLTALRKNYFG